MYQHWLDRSAGHYVYDTGNCRNCLVTHQKNRELLKDLLAGYRWDAGCFQGAHLFQSVSLLILGSLPPFRSNLQDTDAVLKSLLHNRNLHQLGDKYSSQFHAAYIYWSLVILLTQHGFWSGVGCFVYNTFQDQRDFSVHTGRKCGALNEGHSISDHWGVKFMPRGAKLSLGLDELK